MIGPGSWVEIRWNRGHWNQPEPPKGFRGKVTSVTKKGDQVVHYEVHVVNRHGYADLQEIQPGDLRPLIVGR